MGGEFPQYRHFIHDISYFRSLVCFLLSVYSLSRSKYWNPPVEMDPETIISEQLLASPTSTQEDGCVCDLQHSTRSGQGSDESFTDLPGRDDALSQSKKYPVETCTASRGSLILEERLEQEQDKKSSEEGRYNISTTVYHRSPPHWWMGLGLFFRTALPSTFLCIFEWLSFEVG